MYDIVALSLAIASVAWYHEGVVGVKQFIPQMGITPQIQTFREVKVLARKKETSFETAEKVFPTRLRELMKERNESQQVLAEALGVQRQTVSNYANGQSDPNWEMIGKICKHYKVSADWMLGLTDIKTDNHDVRSICEYTGLTPLAVSRLHYFAEFNENGGLEQRYIQRLFVELLEKETLCTMAESTIKAGCAKAIYDDQPLEEHRSGTSGTVEDIFRIAKSGNVEDFRISAIDAAVFFLETAQEIATSRIGIIIEDIVEEIAKRVKKNESIKELLMSEDVETAEANSYDKEYWHERNQQYIENYISKLETEED